MDLPSDFRIKKESLMNSLYCFKSIHFTHGKLTAKPEIENVTLFPLISIYLIV